MINFPIIKKKWTYIFFIVFLLLTICKWRKKNQGSVIDKEPHKKQTKQKKKNPNKQN